MHCFEKAAFYPADILIPRDVDLTKWSVVACDQYTSQPAYWERVQEEVDGAPSTLHLIFPELYLEQADADARIARIHRTMDAYLQDGVFDVCRDAYIYVERTDSHGKIRRGLVGAVDLEQYDYTPGSNAVIRATEGTVVERIPPRVKVRRGAALELPHVMLLIDDPACTVMECAAMQKGRQVYDFELMQQSGHLRGWRVADCGAVAGRLAALAEKNAPRLGSLLYAVGDGNHSLATAKAFWEELKAQGADAATHPARYALAEVVNIHDASLEFEPIHRVVFDCDPEDLLRRLRAYYKVRENGAPGRHALTCIYGCKEQTLYIENPPSNLEVGTLQRFLDDYVAQAGVRVDYIHGGDVVRELAAREGTVGFILPAMEKPELFQTVVKDGVLPRKTFSMGDAADKRFYLECRRIQA